MGYGIVARQLHWIMAVAILVMIPVGLIMTDEGLGRATQDRLFILHKNLGALLLILVAVRLVWRLLNPPPPLPASMPAVQRVAAVSVHWGLYLMVFVMAASGYARVRLGGFPIEYLDALGVPSFLPESEAAAEVAKRIHATAKYALGALILVHVGAAAHHGLVKRDGVFSRMWPPFGRARHQPRIQR